MGNSKQLFSTINHLLKPRVPSLNGINEERCNDFMASFKTKTDLIRTNLTGNTNPPMQTSNTQLKVSKPLKCFPEVTQQKVEDIIRKMRSSTCALDPFPTALVKAHIPAIGPMITKVINQSLQAGHVPVSLKTVIIRPLLKKTTLDPDVLSNYRPISNLPFLSKVLEKVVATHLQDHLKYNNLFEKFQSGFRPAHSTETALVRVTNDLLMTADSGSPSLLILLDLSAAFDTIDHGILLDRLKHIGLTDAAFAWFQSYLTGRTEYISIGSAKSQSYALTYGVPQGSVLGPILFTLYMLPLGQIINQHGIPFHCYADDIQLYIRIDTTSSCTAASFPSSSTSILADCLDEIKAWMESNFLQLNGAKTEVMLIGTPHQIQSSPIASVTVSGHTTPLTTTVTNLGIKLDQQLNFESHIKHLCKISFYHLRNIAKLRPTLTVSDAEKLVHAFVSSRLDYCNALFIGLPNKSLQRLQYIQNSAARILKRVRKHEHITPVLQSLHWLPVSVRIEYKVSLLAYQCIHGNAPPYLKELLTPQTSSRSLRSANSNRLLLPRTKLSTMGDRAFCSAAPRLWNALPDELRAPQSIDSFKKGLKTFLFRRTYHS
uniref:Reverse transcriptase domain-containing protein n=1 Tax=Astyanax mexicanus TaxID=7994 RepID=A0A3B1KGG3_ASTMX